MKLSIGENIRTYRKKTDLTQEELAERLGVTYQSVSRWENGTTYPDIELLPAISQMLGVTVDELISGHRRKHACELLHIDTLPMFAFMIFIAQFFLY